MLKLLPTVALLSVAVRGFEQCLQGPCGRSLPESLAELWPVYILSNVLHRLTPWRSLVSRYPPCSRHAPDATFRNRRASFLRHMMTVVLVNTMIVPCALLLRGDCQDRKRISAIVDKFNSHWISKFPSGPRRRSHRVP